MVITPPNAVPTPAMHHQATQKATELFQNHFVMLVDMTIVLQVGIFGTGRGYAVINTIKTDSNADHHRHDG